MSLVRRRMANAVSSIVLECQRYVDAYLLEHGTKPTGAYRMALCYMIDGAEILAIGLIGEEYIKRLIVEVRTSGGLT